MQCVLYEADEDGEGSGEGKEQVGLSGRERAGRRRRLPVSDEELSEAFGRSHAGAVGGSPVTQPGLEAGVRARPAGQAAAPIPIRTPSGWRQGDK